MDKMGLFLGFTLYYFKLPKTFFFLTFNKLNQLYGLTVVQLLPIPILAEEMKKFHSLSLVNDV